MRHRWLSISGAKAGLKFIGFLFLILAWLTILGAIQLLHDHAPDLKPHDHCPAHQLEMTFVAAGIVISWWLGIFFPAPKKLFRNIVFIVIPSNHYLVPAKRAPPFEAGYFSR